MERRMKTRNQRKREAIKDAVLVVTSIILCGLLTVWAIGIWAEHPAEQHISGREYLASMQE